MTINAADVKKLRDQTGAGMMAAKAALEEAKGDFTKAVEVLRLKGIASAAKKADREANNGLVGAYVHGGKIGVLVEVNCETDFVARTDDFKEFVHDLAMHIAAANPTYLDPESVPTDVIASEKAIYASEVEKSGKPTEHAEKIIEGKLNKFYQSVCLTKQAFIKNPDESIEDLVKGLIAKIGENVVISQFSRIELGEKN